MISGIVGKPNVGKSTFFSSATLMSVPIANYPFTTINANIGTCYIRVKCVHEELGLKNDNPVNSTCFEGERLIPLKLVDVAGLVPQASKGRGLGNKFLDDLRQADALIHVIDSSGSTDEEGRAVPAGTHDPAKDVEFVRNEVVLWVKSILEKDWARISRSVESGSSGSPSLSSALVEKLSGLGIKESSIEEAALRARLKLDRPTSWSSDDLYEYANELLRISKPMLIAANKCDQNVSSEIIASLQKNIGEEHLIVPCAAEAELLLRRASQASLIKYFPGDESFEIKDASKINAAQRKALELVNTTVMDRWKGTGVQKAINSAYLSLLKGIVVYPVEDETKLTDKKGNVLPDARVMHKGDTAKDLANAVHSDLGNTFLYAIDARTGLRVGADYELKNNDVLKIVASARKG